MTSFRCATVFLLLNIAFALSSSIVESEAAYERRMLKDLETRKLLLEMDELQELEEELNKRAQDKILMNQLKDLLMEKRQLRQTPVPVIRKLKMTPPPDDPYQIIRLKVTPVPPEGLQRRPTPASPYELEESVRHTPKPLLRLTPGPPGDLAQIDDSIVRPRGPTPFPPVYPEEIGDIPKVLRPTPVPGSSEYNQAIQEARKPIVNPSEPDMVNPPRPLRPTPPPGSAEYQEALDRARDPQQLDLLYTLLAKRAEARERQARMEEGELYMGFFNKPH